MSIRARHILFVAGVAAALSASVARGQALDATFSYQGRIEVNGSAPTGLYDMTFRLFDAPTGGNQVGFAGFGNVQVNDGLFNLPVNFGDAAFTPGQSRWVEIAVRAPADPAYTTLSGRQKLNATPFASVSRFPWTPGANGLTATFNGNFVGINRQNALSSNEVFGIRTNFGGTNYGGMYIQTDSAQGKPFYGYNTGNTNTAWTYLDGASGSWRLFLGGDRVTVTGTGDTGIGTTTPGAKLDVAGDLRISAEGALQFPDRMVAEYGFFRNEFETKFSAGIFSFESPNIILGNFEFIPLGGGSLVTGKVIGDGATGGFIGGGGSFRTFQGVPIVGSQVIYDNFGTIAGGSSNTVGTNDGDPFTQTGGTVSGGLQNIASGAYATVPGGELNHANGDFAFAAGRRAKANGPGMFVLSDSNDFDFGGTGSNAMFARFTNGYFFYTGVNGSGVPNAGARLLAGSGSWTSLSDEASKHAFEPVDASEILDKVASMPVQRWSYKSQDAAVRHIGPTAQDFHAAFGVGDDPKGITTVDADGVALAAIQGLNAKVEAQARTIDAQNALIESQRRAIEELARRLEAIERNAD